MVLGSIYRPPNTSVPNFINSYTEMCQKLSSFKHVVIGLDHNLDLLKSSMHSQTQQFLEATLQYNLIPTITKPTRVTTVNIDRPAYTKTDKQCRTRTTITARLPDD